MGVCNSSMFCCTLLYVHSSIAIILMGKRELIALLNLSSGCLVMVERLFLEVPRGCLRFVIVVLPDHTHLLYIYTEGYSGSTEPIDVVNILPLARFEPTTSTTPPSTTPDIDATNCATETSPKKDVQEALILTTPDAVHVVYWFLFNAWHLFRSQVKA